MAERIIYLTQINELERTTPKHPQLGQWKARLSRVDQVLGEIADAEAAAAAGNVAHPPRAGLVPEDRPLQPFSVSIPLQRPTGCATSVQQAVNVDGRRILLIRKIVGDHQQGEYSPC